jgi:hypothetical protein
VVVEAGIGKRPPCLLDVMGDRLTVADAAGMARAV